MNLVDMMAKACYYAQEHIDDPDAWPIDKDFRANKLECVSFQMACFLSQNTKGHEGVEWDVILEELIEHPMKKESEWKKILNQKAKELGGWVK